jgi:hypothetical protein
MRSEREKGGRVFTTAKAHQFAQQWIESWNAHDLGRIMAHYSNDIVFSSPFVKKIAGNESGMLQGSEDLRKYFEAGLAKFPNLQFHLRVVLVGMETVTLVYDSVNDLLAAETMAWNATGEISRVWAQYDRID